MPPKPLGLGLHIPAQVPDPRESWDAQGPSVILTSKSHNPYEFSSEGLIKAKGKEEASHYKVSEQDLFLIKQLGAGACGTVHKAYLGSEMRFVAVKRVNIMNKETRHQLLADVRALSDVPDCPGLIKFHGAYYSQDSNQVNIVLDYVDGGSLADLLKQVKQVPEPMLASLAKNMLMGLAALHNKHVVHRDIKPANILVSLGGQAKISDFGISTTIANTVGKCDTYTGTVTYMSPERIKNNPYSASADIWSLGLVLLECTVGRYPYSTTAGPMDLMLQILSEPPELPPPGAISQPLRHLLESCLAMEPMRRPSAAQLLEHPWLTRSQELPQDGLKHFLRALRDPLEQIDDIAFSFAWGYYKFLSQGSSGVAQLALLYRTNASVLQYQGVAASGQAPILRLLQGAVSQGGTWRITSCDSQPFGMNGDILVHVLGTWTPPRGPGSTAQRPMCFAESFVLSQCLDRGVYYVVNQVYRLL